MIHILQKLLKPLALNMREGAKALLSAAYEAGVANEKKDWATAEKKWRIIINEFGNETPVDIWVRASMALRRQGRYARAEETISRAIKLYPNHVGVMNEFAEIAQVRQDWPEAIKRWHKILGKWDKKQLATTYVRLPFAYMRIGKYDKARRLMDEGVKLHPNNISVLEAYAQLAVESQDWPEALKRWRNIIDAHTESAPASAWVGLVRSLKNSSELDKADQTAILGIERFPNDPWLRMEFAEIANDRQDWPVALKRWQSANYDLGGQTSTPLWIKLHIRMNVSVLNRITNIKEYKNQIKRYRINQSPKRIAIYTSLTKDYDLLKLPEVIDEGFDYIVYTDASVDGMGVFEIRKLNQP
ncbi:MAG: tetratricopeptide repeat protein, partial [Candidatus Saccharimonadales bacterium]